MNYALVTGASSGIGMEIARQLAERGYPLVLLARRKDRLEALKADIQHHFKVDVQILALDLCFPDAALQVQEALKEKGIVLDILVNNAGYGMGGRFLDMEMGEVEQMIRLNAITLTHLTQVCVRDMVGRQHGFVLNVASAAAFLPSPYVAAYAATKAYVLSFSEAIRFELKGTGVSITTLYPGITETEFNSVASLQHPPMMNMSILSARRVARAGLRAMFRRRRRIVPGFINKVNAVLSQVFHRGIITGIAGSLLKEANAIYGK